MKRTMVLSLVIATALSGGFVGNSLAVSVDLNAGSVATGGQVYEASDLLAGLDVNTSWWHFVVTPASCATYVDVWLNIDGTLKEFLPTDSDWHVGSVSGQVWLPVSGTLAATGSLADVTFSRTPRNPQFTLSGTYVPVPEPATMVLLGSGLLGLVGAIRKKK